MKNILAASFLLFSIASNANAIESWAELKQGCSKVIVARENPKAFQACLEGYASEYGKGLAKKQISEKEENDPLGILD